MAASLKATIELEGADQILKQLEGLGKAGEKAFVDIKKAADNVGGFDKLKTDEVRQKLKELGIEGPEAFNKIREAVETATRFERLLNGIDSVQSGFARLAQGAIAFGRALVPVAVVAGAAAAAFQKMADSAKELVIAVGTAAAESSTTIEKIDGLRRIFNDAGVSTEVFLRLMKGINSELAKTKTEQVKALAAEVENLRKGGQFDVSGMVALQRIAQGVGEEAKIATEALKKLGQAAKTVDTSRFTLPFTIEEIGRVGLGLEPIVRQAGQLGKQIATFRQPAEDGATAAIKFAEKIAGLSDATERLRAVQEKIPGATIAQANAIAEVGRRADLTKGNVQALTEETLRAAEEAERAAQRSATAWQNLQLTLGRVGLGPSTFSNLLTQFLQDLDKGIQDSAAGIERLNATWNTFNAEFAKGLDTSPAQQAFNALAQIAQGAFDRIKQGLAEAKQGLGQGWDTSAAVQAFQTLMGWIDRLIQKFGEWLRLRQVSNTVGAPSLSDTGNISGEAAGGLIGGRGSGTSDSNLARVSRGEFINRARSVDYYGADVFHALNQMRIPRERLLAALRGLRGYNMGGLVGDVLGGLSPIRAMPLPAYAQGGAVGGDTVFLQFGGQTMGPMHATADVVDQLRKAAVLSQTRSAGPKPSRY